LGEIIENIPMMYLDMIRFISKDDDPSKPWVHTLHLSNGKIAVDLLILVDGILVLPKKSASRLPEDLLPCGITVEFKMLQENDTHFPCHRSLGQLSGTTHQWGRGQSEKMRLAWKDHLQKGV
jgi:hypothetical protein